MGKRGNITVTVTLTRAQAECLVAPWSVYSNTGGSKHRARDRAHERFWRAVHNELARLGAGTGVEPVSRG